MTHTLNQQKALVLWVSELPYSDIRAIAEVETLLAQGVKIDFLTYLARSMTGVDIPFLKNPLVAMMLPDSFPISCALLAGHLNWWKPHAANW